MLLVLTVSACVAASAIGIAAPAEASPYPSWAEVQAAKGNAAAAQKQVSSLDGAISNLQKRASAAGDSASGAGERYQVASLAEDEAKASLAALTAKKVRATKTATKSRQQVGQLVAELSHAGGGQVTVTMLTESDRASDLLYQLGAMTNLTSRTAGLLEQARADENLVSALTDQAAAAQSALAARTKTASAALSAANALADKASTALAVQEQSQTQLIEQVAYLKGTSVDAETAYFAGKAAGTLADTVPAPDTHESHSTASTGAASGASGSTSTSSKPAAAPSSAPAPAPAPSKPTQPAPAPSKPSAPAPAPPPAPVPAPKPTPPASTGTPAAVSTAVAFAKAQLGKSYVFGGAGPNVWDCSGLMMGSYNAAGVFIGGHNVHTQYDYLRGQGRMHPLSQAKLGDILFYYNTGDGYYHDAMYLGNGTMLEAPNPTAKVRIVALRYSQLLQTVGRPVG